MSRNSGLILGTLGRLFSRGTVTGLSEDELLERFVVDRDDAAFAAIVTRHGPMVLGVCRRILRDERDIEDAFQATFLILVRRAGAIRDGRLVGHWLHGVAHRVAVRSRAQAARRYVLERPVTGDFQSAGHSPSQIAGERELLAVLDEELARLPGSLRSPMVLCYLEGLTHDEAASRLGWPVGTVRSRMARARDLLHRRLSRRGLTASGAILPGSLNVPTIPIALIETTVKISCSFATKSSLAAAVTSLTAAGLANEVLHAMMLTRLTVLGATGLTCILTLGGPTLARQFAGSGQNAIPVKQSAGPIQIARADPPVLSPEEAKSYLRLTAAELVQALKGLRNRRLTFADRAEKSRMEFRKAVLDIEKNMEHLKALSQENELLMQLIEGEIKRRAGAGTTEQEGEKPGHSIDLSGLVPAAPNATNAKAVPSQAPPKILNLGNLVIVVSSEGDKVSAASIVGDKLKSVQLSEPGDPALHVDPVFNDSLGTYAALSQTGGKIRRLAVFTKSDWTWHTYELIEPVSRSAPSVGVDEVFFDLGTSIVVYSCKANRWDQLKLPVPLEPGKLDLQYDPFRFTHLGHLYRYHSRTGKFSVLDTRALLEQPDRDTPNP